MRSIILPRALRSFYNQFSAARRPGQAVFEFVLMLPVYIAVVLLAIDFGVWMYAHVSVANAAREGARYGAVKCASSCDTAGEIEDRAVERSGGIIKVAGEVTAWWCDRSGAVGATPAKGDSVAVSVAHPHAFLFVPGVTITIESLADMRIEAADSTWDTASYPESGGSC